MASITVTVTTKADTSRMAVSGNERVSLRRLLNVLHGLHAGELLGKVVSTPSTADAVQASGTITLASVLANDTVTIGKTTLTAKASPATEDEFSQAGTDTQDAASLASKINAHSVLGKVVYATSSAGVVTVTCVVPGLIGNQLALASSNGGRLAVSAAYMTSGAGGQSNTYITLGRN